MLLPLPRRNGAGRRRTFVARWRTALTVLTCFPALLAVTPTRAGSSTPASGGPSHASAITTEAAAAVGARFLSAYPDHLSGVHGNDLIWKDGTRMPIDDGQGLKSFGAWLEGPDLEDMLHKPYPAGAPVVPPALDDDPGRARNAGFFDKMYGNCLNDDVSRRLVDVVWLPSKAGQKLKVTTVNGVHARLDAISRALDALPAHFNSFLIPSAGTYVCRVIAGTDRVSAHGHGIAIDLATKHSDYWRWSRPDADGRPVYRNRIPKEIVDIFETHGFIWGGRWHHYDTMHFEYRPELFPALMPLTRR